MEEKQIISLLLAHQQHGLAQFQCRYTPLMRYIIAPILDDRRDQEECISDVIMKVWEHIDKFNPQKGSFTTWLTVLTRNSALNWARTQKSTVLPLEDAALPSSPGPEEDLLKQERTRALQQALQLLGSTDRSLIYRKYFYLQSTAMIARELGMTERAVEGRLYRIKKKLQNKLGGDFHD